MSSSQWHSVAPPPSCHGYSVVGTNPYLYRPSLSPMTRPSPSFATHNIDYCSIWSSPLGAKRDGCSSGEGSLQSNEFHRRSQAGGHGQPSAYYGGTPPPHVRDIRPWTNYPFNSTDRQMIPYSGKLYDMISII